jgi:hypothetical protein
MEFVLIGIAAIVLLAIAARAAHVLASIGALYTLGVLLWHLLGYNPSMPAGQAGAIFFACCIVVALTDSRRRIRVYANSSGRVGVSTRLL